MKNFLETVKSFFSKETTVAQVEAPSYAGFISKNATMRFTRMERLELGLERLEVGHSASLFNVKTNARVGDNGFVSLDSLTETGDTANVAA